MPGCCFAVQDGEGGPGGASTPAEERTPPLSPAAHHAPHLQVSSALPSLLHLGCSQAKPGLGEVPYSCARAGLGCRSTEFSCAAMAALGDTSWGAAPQTLPAPQQGQLSFPGWICCSSRAPLSSAHALPVFQQGAMWAQGRGYGQNRLLLLWGRHSMLWVRFSVCESNYALQQAA